jgi:hypothetical protein
VAFLNSEDFFMLKTFPKEFVIAAGLLAGPMVLAGAEPAPVKAAMQNDPRFHVLVNFFAARHAPAQSLASEFLDAADQNHLDWRLLPSLSFIETEGGKTSRNNNLFGWNSGRHRFPTARAAIYNTAATLAHGKLYRNKDLNGILHTYNPRPTWIQRVKAVMQSIGSADLTPAIAGLN